MNQFLQLDLKKVKFKYNYIFIKEKTDIFVRFFVLDLFLV